MECDSIDSFSLANDDTKKNGERNVVERINTHSQNIILSSDEVMADDISKNSQRVELENIPFTNQEMDRKFRRAIEMQNNYVEYGITD
jgi:hypothetical protein